jgi:hypothetical protein
MLYNIRERGEASPKSSPKGKDLWTQKAAPEGRSVEYRGGLRSMEESVLTNVKIQLFYLVHMDNLYLA